LPIIEDGKVVGIVSRFDFSGLELDRLDEETASGNGSELQ
jgi:CBS domain-containing protein